MLRGALCCLMLAGALADVPKTMRAVVVSGSAPPGDFSKVKVVTDQVVPRPGRGQVLIRVAASSVNPVDWKLLSSPLYDLVTNKVPGFDVAGTVVEVGSGCTRLKEGAAVWADLGEFKVLGGFVQLGAWAEYAVADEAQVSLKPEALSFQDAAVLPLVGLTDYQALKMTGAPWTKRGDVTVVVTSGSGGTGTVAIQMARAYGASRVITAASPSHFDLLKSLGATDVIDHHTATIWEALANDTVDIVYDNYGAPGTADAAMPALKAGGVFIFLPGIGGAISQHPKPGVKQINYGNCDSSKHEDVDALAALAEAGQLKAVMQVSYGLEDILLALNASLNGHFIGKVGISITSSPTSEQLYLV